MALTPEIRVPQANTLVVASTTAGGTIDVNQANILAIYNIPAESIRSFTASAIVPYTANQYVNVYSANVLAVVKGRTANPRLRTWTFSMDMHDYLILRLGDDETLVYDLYSEQWMDWTSPGLNFWRANVGMNWIGGIVFGEEYGSSILVGDDTYGLLWFLDPEQPYDEHPDSGNSTQETYFERITIGQVPMRGRVSLPCYAAWLTTDAGSPAYNGAGVTLETSDDGGITYDNMGTITVTMDEYAPEISWYSLGQINAPGRLFKITDDGAVARIDGLEMNDPENGR